MNTSAEPDLSTRTGPIRANGQTCPTPLRTDSGAGSVSIVNACTEGAAPALDVRPISYLAQTETTTNAATTVTAPSRATTDSLLTRLHRPDGIRPSGSVATRIRSRAGARQSAFSESRPTRSSSIRRFITAASLLPLCRIVCTPPIEPSVETALISQARPASPGLYGGVLDGVLRAASSRSTDAADR